ncbi:MAG: N-acetylmuramoyl-L-alanine amidase [Chlorobiales bacterium]|nr:N-acetylmuramoyl-L-alanine amidase [Chlorobiales bacterium]
MLLLFHALSPDLVRAEETLTVNVTLTNGQTFSEKIALYQIGNLQMISVPELCNAARLANQSGLSDLTVTGKRRTVREYCTLRPQNHFVTIRPVDSSNASRVLQIGVAPAMVGGTIYLPPIQAGKLLSSWLELQTDYNAPNKALTLNFIPARKAEPTPSANAGTGGGATDNLTIKPKEELDTRFTIPKYSIDEKANGAIIRFYCTRPEVEYEFIRPNKSGIAYLTFRNATGDVKALSQSFSTGILQQVTAIPLRSGGLQLTLTFNTKRYTLKSTEFKREPNTDHFLLNVLSEADVKEIYKSEKEREINATLEHDREKWKLNAIALDAGHGGEDPGAIGFRGTYEKDVTLAVVQELGKLMEENWKDVKVIYTRNSDKFIQLDERGKTANRQNAKLFISVHCNASKNRRANGVEVYMLGLHKTDAALDVSRRENAVISQETDYKTRYKEFTEENLIMVTMAQSAFSQQSQKLADLVNRHITDRTDQDDRGVKQAGFMVLWTPSMPSILIETGYISNPEEEEFLKSKAGQKKLAQAIFEGLKKYRVAYEAHRQANGN